MLTLAGTACGASSDEGLSEISEPDRAALTKWQAAISDVSKAYADLGRTLQEENVKRARAAQERMARSVNAADDLVLDVKDNDLRRLLGDHVEPLRKLDSVLDRYFTYAEGPGNADPALSDRLLGELQTADASAERSDRPFLSQLLAMASPMQRDKIRSNYRQFPGVEEQRAKASDSQP